MSNIQQKHSHLYAPKTVEVRLSDSTPFEVPGRRNLIAKAYTDTASPVLKLSTDLQKVKEGDTILIENMPGTSESSISVVFGTANTVAGSVAAKTDETFRLVGGLWLLETSTGGGVTVYSVNGETGDVVISADDISAAPVDHVHAIEDVTDLQDELEKIDEKADLNLLAAPDIIVSQSPSSPLMPWVGVYTPSKNLDYEITGDVLTGRVSPLWVRYNGATQWEIRWDTNEEHWTLNEEGSVTPIASLASPDPFDYNIFQEAVWTLLSGSLTPSSVIRWSQRISSNDYRIKNFLGATTEENGVGGIVPQPAIGDQTKYLKGNGTFSAIDATEVTTGVLGNARVNFGSPAPIGDVVPNTGAFTTLSSTGTATLPHIHGSLAGNLYVHVRNNSGGNLLKGTPVYATGSVGNTDTILVVAADQSITLKMPALGLLENDLAVNADGNCIIIGELKNFNTDSYTINQELFVGNGVITPTKSPFGEVQSVGVVSRVQQNTGIIVVNMQARRTPEEFFSREVTKYTFIIPATTTLFQIPPLEYKNSLVELILERGDASGIAIRLPLSFPQKALLQTIIIHTGTGAERSQISYQYPQDNEGTSWSTYKQYDGLHFRFYVDHFIGKIGNGLPWSAYFPGNVSKLIFPCGATSPGTSGPIGYWGIPGDLATITTPNRREFEVGTHIRVLGAQLVQDIGGTIGIGQGPSVDPLNPFLSIQYNSGPQVYDLNITDPNYTISHNVSLSATANSLKTSGTIGYAFPNPQFSGVFDLLPGRRYSFRIKWPTFSVAPTTVRNTLILYYIDPYASFAGLLTTNSQYADFITTPKL